MRCEVAAAEHATCGSGAVQGFRLNDLLLLGKTRVEETANSDASHGALYGDFRLGSRGGSSCNAVKVSHKLGYALHMG